MNSRKNCPICMKLGEPFEILEDSYQILRCKHCAFDFRWSYQAGRVYKDFSSPEVLVEEDNYDCLEQADQQNQHQQPDASYHYLEEVLTGYGHGKSRSFLEIGAGFGSRLKLARDRGWNCFAVESSQAGRERIAKLYGNSFFVVESLEQLIPHEFDLIVMLNIIDQTEDACQELFYKLFSLGAITPCTELILTTPNARSFLSLDQSNQADRIRPTWQSWQAAAYSSHALNRLLKKLRFENISVSGRDLLQEEGNPVLPDHEAALDHNKPLINHRHLTCQASGSSFKAFMQERYIPGTWSKIARYEHLFRYQLAAKLAGQEHFPFARFNLKNTLSAINKKIQGKQVLDFGCGTGYGTFILASQAKSVTGLDISAEALEWAEQFQGVDNVTYQQSSTFGSELPANSFDLITCFEMVEHISKQEQQELLKALKRLLKTEGLLLLSTPNPAVTAKYGDNEYHIHEMNEKEFYQYLEKAFPFVRIMRQRLAPAVFISETDQGGNSQRLKTECLPGGELKVLPVAFLAICSNYKLESELSYHYLDETIDYVDHELHRQKIYYRILEENIRLKNEYHQLQYQVQNDNKGEG